MKPCQLIPIIIALFIAAAVVEEAWPHDHPQAHTHHNDEIIAVEQAIKRLEPVCGFNWRRRQEQKVTQIVTDDYETVIFGQIIKIYCERPEPPPPTTENPEPVSDQVMVVIEWKRPTQYTNGRALPANQIRGHHIAIHGPPHRDLTPGPVERYKFTLPAGTYSLRMRTFDLRMRVSNFTDPIHFDVSI